MAQQNADTPVIVLELNELCPPILDRMMAEGRLPNFKSLHAKSDVYVTHTDDPSLEPWVQWPSFHTGQPESVHGAAELDQGHMIDQKRIWDVLADQGLSSVVFGSMNGDTKRRDKVFLVPDPWSAQVGATDPAFDVFHKFISFYVTEHTNPNAKPSKATAAAFLKFMLARGLSVPTMFQAAAQVASEKTSSFDRKWRRAMLLDLMMWDVFEHTYKKRRPDFATFFANSTAFLQHRYWRHMSPDEYKVVPSDEDMRAYGGAVEASYEHMDRLVGRAMKLGGPDTRLVLATALSQEANTSYEHIGGKFVYRPHDFAAVFEWLGGPQPKSFEPVMTHQAWASFETEAQAIEAEARLDAAQSNGNTIMEWRRTDNRLFFWCGLISQVAPGMELTHATSGERIAFDKLFMLVGQVNNSQHCRDGAFWAQRASGAGEVHGDKLPLEEAHDLLLELAGRMPADAGFGVAAE